MHLDLVLLPLPLDLIHSPLCERELKMNRKRIVCLNNGLLAVMYRKRFHPSHMKFCKGYSKTILYSGMLVEAPEQGTSVNSLVQNIFKKAQRLSLLLEPTALCLVM
jgi:hypothetical protein